MRLHEEATPGRCGRMEHRRTGGSPSRAAWGAAERAASEAGTVVRRAGEVPGLPLARLVSYPVAETLVLSRAQEAQDLERGDANCFGP